MASELWRRDVAVAKEEVLCPREPNPAALQLLCFSTPIRLSQAGFQLKEGGFVVGRE